MATSFTRKVFDGTSDRIPIAFPYLDKSHVQVYLNDVLQSPSSYSWPTSGEIQLNAVPANGTVGYAPRKTPDEPITVFTPGNLDPNDLNVATLQPLFLAAEARDSTTDFFMRAWVSGNFATGGTITKSPEGYVATFDALGNLIGTFDGGDISDAQGYALAAKDWRDQALGFRNEAEAFRNTASQKATDAAQSALDAAGAVGPAIRDSALKSSMTDTDQFGIWDNAGSALKSIQLGQVIARIFQTTRKISNANFQTSLRLWDSAANTKGMSFDLTAITAGQTRSLKMPDADVDLSALGTRRSAAITPSGNAFLFSAIPAGVQHIRIKFAGLQIASNGQIVMLLGTSGGLQTTGYFSKAVGFAGTSLAETAYTAAFLLNDASAGAAATIPNYGFLDLQRQAPGSNVWSTGGTITRGNTGQQIFVGGVTLTGELTQVQFSTIAGNIAFSGANAVAIEWDL